MIIKDFFEIGYMRNDNFRRVSCSPIFTKQKEAVEWAKKYFFGKTKIKSLIYLKHDYITSNQRSFLCANFKEKELHFTDNDDTWLENGFVI